MGADNQQETLDPSWVVGFTDAEGCFYVGINKMPKMSLGWQVLPEFRIVQHERDEDLLRQVRDFFGFGEVRKNHGDRKDFRVRGLDDLTEVVRFFNEHQLKTKKRHDFEKFAEIIKMMRREQHLERDGLDRIAEVVSEMNEQTTPSYLQDSSETVRQATSQGG
jgi:hypothetical protein